MLRFQSLQILFFFSFWEDPHRVPSPEVMSMWVIWGKEDTFHTFLIQVSVCASSCCVFPLGWSLIFWAAWIQTELFDGGEGRKSPTNNPHREIQVAPASEGVFYGHFLLFYKVQMENVTLENGTPLASVAPGSKHQLREFVPLQLLCHGIIEL